MRKSSSFDDILESAQNLRQSQGNLKELKLKHKAERASLKRKYEKDLLQLRKRQRSLELQQVAIKKSLYLINKEQRTSRNSFSTKLPCALLISCWEFLRLSDVYVGPLLVCKRWLHLFQSSSCKTRMMLNPLPRLVHTFNIQTTKSCDSPEFITTEGDTAVLRVDFNIVLLNWDDTETQFKKLARISHGVILRDSFDKCWWSFSYDGIFTQVREYTNHGEGKRKYRLLERCYAFAVTQQFLWAVSRCKDRRHILYCTHKDSKFMPSEIELCCFESDADRYSAEDDQMLVVQEEASQFFIYLICEQTTAICSTVINFHDLWGDETSSLQLSPYMFPIADASLLTGLRLLPWKKSVLIVTSSGSLLKIYNWHGDVLYQTIRPRWDYHLKFLVEKERLDVYVSQAIEDSSSEEDDEDDQEKETIYKGLEVRKFAISF